MVEGSTSRDEEPAVAFLAGDGVGPEVLGVARHVLQAAGFRARWVDLPVGWSQWTAHGDALPPATLEGLRGTRAALFGAITSKGAPEAERELVPALRGKGLVYRSPILRLRQELGLSINLRPVRAYAGNPNNLRQDVDCVIFRENTEGLYAGLEAYPFPPELRQAWARAVPSGRVPAAGADTAVSLRVVTRAATERVAAAAFEFAATNGRRKVTLVEKANVLRATGGLVRQVFAEVAARFPGIATEELHVDAACARFVRHPESFDVVVATNLFGDILSDVAAEVAGGLPLAASGNLGRDYALFEPVHGSAPDVAGQGVANPLGAVLAAAMLARHVGQGAVAEAVESAVASMLADGAPLPMDLGGTASTRDVEQALVERVSRRVNAP